MDAYKNDPIVRQAVAKGVAWAVKLNTRGWSSLTTQQKKVARSALSVTQPPAVVVPRRTRVRNPVPAGLKSGNGKAGKSSTLTRSEFICNVSSTTGVTPTFQSWIINPREVKSFPQSSVCSVGYNKYRITDFRIRFSTSCSDTMNGKVAIGFTPDSSDPVPVDKSQLYGMQVYADTPAKESVTLKTAADNTIRFLRDSSSDDAKLVDYGRVVLATYGFDSTAPSVIGELFFEYTVVYLDPTYVVALTQYGTLTTSSGPPYATLTTTATSTSIELNTHGKWLVVWISADEVINSPVISGSGASGSVTVVSDAQTTVVAVVTANLPGAIISNASTAAPSSLEWYVSRL
uniref:Capsid protein n=1 Tax=Pelargonium flower break virus TaxID=35291 RepID=Q1PGI0_9TOMB|nr:coat protein [Pelargonium flower break virus]